MPCGLAADSMAFTIRTNLAEVFPRPSPFWRVVVQVPSLALPLCYSSHMRTRYNYFSCDQAAVWMVFSVRLSVRLSHLFTPQPFGLEGYCNHGSGGRAGGYQTCGTHAYLCNRHDIYNTYGRDVVGYCHLRLTSRCTYPAPGQDFQLQRLHVFAHSRYPHPAMKLWCQVPFTKSKTIFQIDMYCMQCFLKSKFIKSSTFNDENRWIIKKVMVLKKLLPHLATRGPYSPGGWRCDEAWLEQTFVYPPVMCQQRLSYCTW